MYAVAEYWGIIDHESTIFEVVLLGDVNGDSYVNAKDAVILGKAFGTQEGDPLYNARADINKRILQRGRRDNSREEFWQLRILNIVKAAKTNT